MTNKKVTVCLTSCGRFDLLQRTINSFFAVNLYPIEKFIITEDSAIPKMRDKTLEVYGDKVELIFNKTNLGMCKSIDNMYNLVNTEYIFHTEDDWTFRSNNNFMQESLDILEERQDIHQVWIRNFDHHPSIIEKDLHYTTTGVEYKMVVSPHPGDWGGFSFNPGLRRLSDYKKMFPNGYSEFILPNKKAVFTEHNCNLHAMKQGYRAAIIKNHCCDHTGGGRSTIGEG